MGTSNPSSTSPALRSALWRAVALAAAATLMLTLASQRARPAEAAFHLAEIHEAMFGIGTDPNAQYVEINMQAIGQNLVQNSRLSAWNANGTFNSVLLLVPGDVASGTNRRWIMGTTEFQTQSGLSVDFTFPAASLPATGMICWGAPGLSVPPADPNSWDHTNPLNYTDCLPYGGYSQSNIRFGPATPFGLGDTDSSLTRIIESGNNASTDYALVCPSPQNNANQTVAAGPDTDGDTQRDCIDTDDDGDGRSDQFETNGGTNKKLADTDSDTISDGANAVPPAAAGPDNCPLIANGGQGDGDSDGLGTACDPDDANPDFDGDGCEDGNEAYRLNPLDPTDAWDWPDVDGNGSVGFGDFLALLAAWNSNPMSGSWNPDVNFDQNNAIGFGDFLVILSRWNQTCP